LAAETIFMALVICRVFFTLRMRRFKSSTFAIFQFSVISGQLSVSKFSIQSSVASDAGLTDN
jgi:hypothetical protein